MQIKLAKHSGFCFGVKRAINIAKGTLENSKNKNNIYSRGAIIHNPQVVNELSRKGLKVVNDIGNIKKGTVIISSHGAPIEVIKKLKKKKIKIIDATCPFVKYAHRIVKDLKKKDYKIVIIGDKKHPEVKALLSLTECGKKSNRIGIISQTTQNKDNYLKGIIETLENDFSEVRIFNTICNDTLKRQKLTHDLLKESDVMIIVGGKNSANTKRLHQICKESGVKSYHIETEEELKKKYFLGKTCAGVVSGASTPDSIIKKVIKRIKELTR